MVLWRFGVLATGSHNATPSFIAGKYIERAASNPESTVFERSDGGDLFASVSIDEHNFFWSRGDIAVDPTALNEVPTILSWCKDPVSLAQQI
jgi:hypothetical protein